MEGAWREISQVAGSFWLENKMCEDGKYSPVWGLLNRSEYLLDSAGTDGLSSPVRTQCKAKNVKLFKFILQVLCVINVITENQIDLPWTCFFSRPLGFCGVPQGSRPPCLIGNPASLLITHIKSLNWANYSDCKTVMSSGDASVPRL